jgi:heme/copper-type cytochrome/quinol oxidase subunit 3
MSSKTLAPHTETTSTGFPSARLGMLIFLSSEAMMFTTLIASYLVLRSSQTMWPPPNQPALNVTLTAINTFFLISSSFTFHIAEMQYKKGSLGKFLGWLGLTILLGVLFLSIQAYEYTNLIKEGLSLSSSTYGSVFFTLTGFHGFHVFVGVLLMNIVFWRGNAKNLSTKNHAFVENVGMYWHFVDIVWICLFTTLYLL